MRSQNPTNIFVSTAVPAAAFTASATTDALTSNGHGLANGDQVVVSNSGGGLPGGLATSTIYYVISTATNTFQLATAPSGSAINLTSAGTGTHTFNLLGRSIFVEDFQHITLAFDTKNSANLTLKFVGSFQEIPPNWYAAQSETNQFDVVDVIDYEDGASIDGDTGIAPSGTDDHRHLEANVSGLRWISAIIPAASYTIGNVSLVAKPFTNQ